jgi:ubiquinone/menaquinone biosynthesis C-methylase UbiE
METRRPESEKTFLEKMKDILNYGALNLGMALGYETGLFDVMDTFDTPQVSSAIAEKSGLNSRYVAEWLGIMVSGDIVELSLDEAGQDLFYLPKAHGDLITRRAGNSNLGVYTQEIPLLTRCAMEPVLNGFHTGSGIDYSHYPAFHDFMAQLADAKHRQVLVDTFLPSVDNGRIVRKLETGIRVCDLGCSTGTAVLLMAAAFPKSRFVGIDISAKAIEKASLGAGNAGLKNVRFLRIDATAMDGHPDLEKSFDYVTAFDAIHDQTQPCMAIGGVYSILKDNGTFSMIDIAAESRLADNRDLPMGPFLYTVSLLHCMPVGLVDGGTGLGMMWGRQKAVEMLKAAGFSRIDVTEIPDDPFNLHFLCRK